jgi:hypothetical protein
MRKILWGCGLAVAQLAGTVARAAEGDDPKAIIDKAIQAHGGAELLKKFTAQQTKAKGKFYGLGDAIEYTAEGSIQLPDKVRTVIEAPGFKIIQILNGDKGWVSAMGDTNEMNKEQLQAAKEEVYSAGLTRLVTLTGAGYELSPLPEAKVGGKAAAGVLVKHKGHKDVSLFFDKESGLLVKSERKAIDAMSGEEYTATAFPTDYKKVEGVMVAHKMTLNKNGDKLIEQEYTDYKLAEKLDDKPFEKP